MQGTVLLYKEETNTGLISGHDGIRYSFTLSEWMNENTKPREGQKVDFDMAKGKKAVQIILVKSFPLESKKNKWVACALAFLLGGLGVHKFYLRRTTAGVLYLLFCWTFIPALIGFIEAVIYLLMSEKEFNNKYNTD